MKVAILDDYQRLALEYADWKSLPGAEVRVFHEPLRSTEQAAKALEPFEIVCLMRERTPFGRALIDKLPNLKFVSLTGARSPSLDTAALKERGIPVSNTRSAGGGGSTVELTWGLIIAAARGLAKGERNMRAGKWHQDLGPGFALAGRRLGLLGLGNIGARVAAIGKAFGMECIAWSQNLTDEKAQAAGVVEERKKLQHRQLGTGGFEFPGPWGVSVSRNITSSKEKGIGAWSDDEIKRAITQGIRKDGSKLKPPMGFHYYATVTPADLDAIVAYLRTVPAKE